MRVNVFVYIKISKCSTVASTLYGLVRVERSSVRSSTLYFLLK